MGDDPPFVGMAVKVTEVPSHTGFTDGTINILTGRPGIIVIEDVSAT